MTARSRCSSLSSFEDSFPSLEMEELRSSLQAEVFKAWAEVEQLQDEKMELANDNMRLSVAYKSSQDREATLQKQVDELQRRLSVAGESSREQQQQKPQRPAFLQQRRPSLFRRNSTTSMPSSSDSIAATNESPKTVCDTNNSEMSPEQLWTPRRSSFNWPNNKQDRRGSDSRRRGSLSSVASTDDRDKMESEYQAQIRDLELERQAIMAKMQVEMTHRDHNAREERKEARKMQLEAMEHLKRQLDMQEKYAQERESNLKNKIDRLKRKVTDKRDFISKQNEKMREYQSYIHELTDEIERFYDDRLMKESKKIHQ